jgi:hypothetical protein
VGEEQVDPRQGLAQRPRGYAARPLQGVVLAGGERHAVGHGPRRRPPRAEHVRVHDVFVDQGRAQSLGERPPARVLKRGTPAEHLDIDPARAKQREALAGGVTGQPARLDAMGAQRQRETQRAELGAARLEHRDHARHPHRASP